MRGLESTSAAGLRAEVEAQRVRRAVATLDNMLLLGRAFAALKAALDEEWYLPNKIWGVKYLSFVFGRPGSLHSPGGWGLVDVGFQTPLSAVIGQQHGIQPLDICSAHFSNSGICTTRYLDAPMDSSTWTMLRESTKNGKQM